MSQVFKRRSNSTNFKYRKWSKIIQPLIRYDKKSSLFSFALDFFQLLQKIQQKGYKLNLNIPTTLSGLHDNCLKTVYKGVQQQIGTISFIPSILKVNFDIQIQKQISQKIDNLGLRQSLFKKFVQQKQECNTLQQSLPFVVLKQKVKGGQFQSAESKSFILSKDQYKKIGNIQQNQVMQIFIYGSSSTCSITRFFYFPKKETLSIAYKIDNNENYLQKRFSKSSWRIKQSNQHSFTFVKIMHHNKSFSKQAINLVKVIQSFQKKNVEKIVCDWIIDSTNRYILFDIKQIKFQSVETVMRVNKQLNDVLSLISCCVCQQKFQSAQINKLITHKLIWQFFEHLKKRKVQLTFKPSYKYSSNTARVCDLCYMLVVSESKLIELETTIAKATNSIQKTENVYSKMLEDLNENEREQYKEKNLRELYCWRLFFYIEDIKQVFSLDQSFQNQNSYFIMINLHNQITSFKLKDISHKSNLQVKGIKITYLFSQKEKIQKFLNKSQIIIRITNGNNWNSVIAEGISNSLYDESQKFSMRKYKQILLFNQKSKYCVLGLHIGIKLDGRYSTQKLHLNKVYDAYVSNEKYINSLSIPPQWMQIIDPIYCINKQKSKKFQYQMNMSQKQIKNVLPTISFNSEKKRLFL